MSPDEVKVFANWYEAQLSRLLSWTGGADQQVFFSNNSTREFFVLELAGESGELANIMKKIERERLGWQGSRATEEQLADELADVVICARNLFIVFSGTASAHEDDSEQSLTESELTMSAQWAMFRIGYEVGKICEHTYLAKPGTMDILVRMRCLDIELLAKHLASKKGIDLDRAVAKKFNATSLKLGFRERMKLPAPVPRHDNVQDTFS
jgi:NTP pyrophosphatase (non-canonical NTP hydrolase)